MISIIGNSLLWSSLVLSIITIILRNNTRSVFFYLSSITPIIAFAVLIVAFVGSDFTIKNVFLNSSSLLPLIYKISASWASHEGSMLLWVSLLSLMGMIYIKNSRVSLNLNEFAIVILSCINILFLLFIIFTSNPFEQFSFIPHQGMGLNPVLQDIGLAIHPPILYLGNVSYSILFVTGWLLLYKPEEKTEILYIAKYFSNFALATLTIGIGLGSWWAYRELGWGGFWFFDPVENISLLPWLCGIALHHSLIITSRNGKLMLWTTMLSLFSFLLVIYGTFIVRSGIISSVHSFAFAPERGFYGLILSIIITIFAITWFLIRNKYLFRKKLEYYHEHIILFGNILWMIALSSILIAIVYQIYCACVWRMDIAIDIEYFFSVFIPIFVPILILAATVPIFINKLSFHTLVSVISTIILTLILHYVVELGVISFCISCASIYLMIEMLVFLFSSNADFYRKYSLFLGHFGFGLLAITIVVNNAVSEQIDFIGKIGDQVIDKNMSIKLDNIKFSDSKNYYRQIAIFTIEDKNNNIIVLKPENRLYKIENILSQEVDIFSFLAYDIYAVLTKIDKNIIHARIYYHPLISFIWLSIFVIFSGFAIFFIRS